MRRVQVVDLQLDAGDDRAMVWDGDGVRVMRVRLQPGEALPPHDANANVVLVPLSGRLRFATGDQVHEVGVGEILTAEYRTPMDVSNPGDETTVFLVVRTPPAEV